MNENFKNTKTTVNFAFKNKNILVRRRRRHAAKNTLKSEYGKQGLANLASNLLLSHSL